MNIILLDTTDLDAIKKLIFHLSTKPFCNISVSIGVVINKCSWQMKGHWFNYRQKSPLGLRQGENPA